MMSKKSPQLRFEGFTDDWEERKLGDFLKTPEKVKAHIQSKDDLMTLKLNLGGLESGSNRETLELGSTIYYKRKAGQFIYGKQNFFNGSMAIIPIDLDGKATSGDVPSLDVVGILSEYLYVYVSRGDYWKSKEAEASGTGSKRIHEKILQGFDIKVPSTQNEQTKIGSLFKQLDNTITIHQRKLDLLKEQKKGYLQKMFPKNGEKIPELRFAGFADDWEERKLGELSNIVGGGTPSTSNPEYWDGDIDWYAPAEIGEQSYVSKSKKTITELGLKKSSARILPVGTVLFTSRAGIGNTAILGKEATTNQGFQSIVPDQNKLDSYFIYSRTNELKRYGEVTGAGSTFVEVSGKQMSKMSIMIPELSEQKKIGSFFKQLDNTIALHQRKLDLLKEQKKGYLQKMFV